MERHRKGIFAYITIMLFMLQTLVAPPLVGIANADALVPSDVRAFALAKGLKSLRTAIEEDATAGKGLPLLLNPELGPRNVPLPKNLNKFVKNRLRAAQLGKALFFELAIGSDGNGCVSCHFHAGADNRVKNQLSPDFIRVENDRDGDINGFHAAASDPDFVFQHPDSLTWGPNYTLDGVDGNDFPFVQDIGNGNNVLPSPSATNIEPAPGNTNDVASSQGVFFTQFDSVDPLNRFNPDALALEDIRDDGTPISDFDDGTTVGFFGANFQVDATNGAFGGKVNVRRVEPRNTPTNINAVFNFHNFWDGRANNRFNGVNPLGKTDENARIWKKGKKGDLEQFELNMKNASLASQAVGPPLSEFEMSFFGRSFVDIAQKVLDRQALENQVVDTTDSLLGSLSTGSLGLTKTYRELIQEAFKNEFWDTTELVPVSVAVTNVAPNVTVQTQSTAKVSTNGGIPLIEANFSFFWGVSIMLYQAELVSDDTPVDRFLAGDDGALDQDELLGLAVFVGFDDGSGIKDGRCVNCHGGPETTNASVRNTQGPEGVNLIEAMFMGDGLPGFYDNGFYNIGVTPTAEDLGRGGSPGNFPVSSSRQFLFEAGVPSTIPFEIIGLPIRGLQKPPGEMGSKKGGTLGVIEIQPVTDVETFIPICEDDNRDNRCDQNDTILLQRVNVDGNFKTSTIRNVELTGPYFHNGGSKTLLEVVEFYDRGGNFCRLNIEDLDPDVEFIGLSEDEEEGLVKFMMAYTDERVRNREAPFDHPEYIIPDGHPGSHTSTTADTDFGDNTPDPPFFQALDLTRTVAAVGASGGDPLEAFHVGLGLTDGLVGHMVAGGVVSAVNVNSPPVPKCNRPPQQEFPLP